MTRRDKCPTFNRPFDRPAPALGTDKTNHVPDVDKTLEFIDKLRNHESAPPPSNLRQGLLR